MKRKQKLIALFRQGQQDLSDLAASLVPEERAEAGAVDSWAFKDMVGHLGHWQRVLLRDLDGVKRQPIDEANIDDVNAVIFQERRDWPWERVWEDVQETSDELMKRLRAMTEDELNVMDRWPWQEGRPVWKQMLGNGFSHGLGHVSGWYAHVGQHARGLELAVKGAELLRGLDDSPKWQANCIYNLACQYALSGDKERALPLLAESLRLNPELLAWARQDGDLACLRDEPAYRALYPTDPAA